MTSPPALPEPEPVTEVPATPAAASEAVAAPALEAATEGVSEAGPEAASGAATEGVSEAGSEAAAQAGPEAAAEAAAETVSETVSEAVSEAAAEAAPEAAAETVSETVSETASAPGRAPRRPAWATALLLTVFFGLLALAVAPWLADAAARRRVPQDADVAGAVAAVRAHFRAQDAVRVEPSWWLRPWHGLEAMGPGTEAWPFPALLVGEGFDPVEALGHARLFVVAGFGRDAALPPELTGAGTARTDLYTGGAVSVAVWELDRARRLRTLSADFATLAIGRRDAPDAALAPCPLRGDAHRCGREPWLDVRVAHKVVWQREVRWLFVHPGPAGARLEVSWADLPRQTAAGPTWLYVRVGPSLEAVRHPDGKPVTVVVRVDGREVDRFDLAPQRFWMERRALRLPPGEAGARATFEVFTEDAGWRETLLEADVLATLPAALRTWATHVVE